MKLINEIIRYFDLYSVYRADTAKAQAGGKAAPLNLWIVLHFIALYLGIVSKHYLDYLSTGGNKFALNDPRFIVSLIIATAIFPAVYQQTIVKPDLVKEAQKHGYNLSPQPNFVELCVTFAAGLGYQSLLGFEIKTGG